REGGTVRATLGSPSDERYHVPALPSWAQDRANLTGCGLEISLFHGCSLGGPVGFLCQGYNPGLIGHPKKLPIKCSIPTQAMAKVHPHKSWIQTSYLPSYGWPP